MPLRGKGSCAGGGAPRDSAGSGATEEGLTSRGGRHLRLPLRFGLRPQGPCRVGTTRGLRPPEQLERPAGFPSSDIGCEKSRPPSGAKRQPTGLFGSLYLYNLGFPGGPLGWEDPLEDAMATHSRILAPRGNPACRGAFGCRRKAVRDCFARRQPTRLPCPWDSPGKNTMAVSLLLSLLMVSSG